MARYEIDAATLLHIVANDIDIDPAHQLVAPHVIRSQALALLLEAVSKGEITEERWLWSDTNASSAARPLHPASRLVVAFVRLGPHKSRHKRISRVADVDGKVGPQHLDGSDPEN